MYARSRDIIGGEAPYEVKVGDLVRQVVHFTAIDRYPAGSTARVVEVDPPGVIRVEYLADILHAHKTLRVWKNHFEPV